MMIPVFSAAGLTVKPRTRRDINLASQDRTDSLPPAFLIKIHHAVHDAVVGNRRTVHAQLFYPRDIILNLVGAVQEAIFRMCMQMRKSQP